MEVDRAGRGRELRAARTGRRCAAALTVALTLAAAALMQSAPAWARTRDFAAAASEEPIRAPPPRASRLFLSVGVGVDAVLADWPQSDLRFASGPTQQVGPGLRMAAGVRLVENIAVFVEGSGTVPAVPLGAGIALAGVGVGADWFVRSESPWRRGWTTGLSLGYTWSRA